MTCGEPIETDDDWKEWRNFVLKELERLNNNLEALREKQENSRNSITALEARIYVAVAIISFLVTIGAPLLFK